MSSRLSSLLAIMAVICIACGDMPDQPATSVTVKVTISGIPSSAEALRASVNLNGMPYDKSPHTYNNSQSLLWVTLPLQTQGQLSVAIDALQGGCQVATGKADVNLTGNTFYELTVSLNLLATKTCTLTILKNGGGRVIANPAGIDCGQTCSFDYPFGTVVSLTGAPDVGMNPGVWSNACSGAGPCSVTITAPTTVGIDFAPKICSKDGWCWENATPQGNDLTGIWIAPSPDNTVYAVGAHGTALKWNGIIWVAMDSKTTQDLLGIWGSGANDIWAVGKGGTILRWNGSAWFTQTSPVAIDLYAIWGTSASDIWAVGVNGTAIHYDGIQWTPFDSKVSDTLTGVWGSGTNDVWAVASRFTTHFDGSAWTAISNGNNYAYSVWGSGPTDVWSAGFNTIMRWQGSAWSSVAAPANGDFKGIWGSGINNIWIANPNGPMLHWRGSRWVLAEPETAGFTALGGIADTTVWAAGSQGQSITGDGTTWSRIGKNRPGLGPGWAASPNDAWAISGDNVNHWDGVQWQPYYAHKGVRAIWGSAPDDVWAVGADISHWDGSNWSVTQGGSTFSLSAVFGTSSKDAWAGGINGQILRWDGANWNPSASLTEPKTGGAANIVQGYADSRGAWLISSLSVFHWTGTTWQVDNAPAGYFLNGIGGANNAEVFVVGGDTKGIVLRWDGTSWKDEAPSGAPLMNSVFVGQAGDAWAVGHKGAIYHWIGTTWVPAESGTGSALLSVFGSGLKNIFAVGANNVVLRKSM